MQHFVWPGINFSWQAQYFRQVGSKNRETHWYEAVSSALNFPFSKEVSPNCFVFNVVNLKKWGRKSRKIASFWMLSSSKILRKSRRIPSFWMLSTLKIEEVSQNCFAFNVVKFNHEEVSQTCFVFDVVKFKYWGSLAERLRFWCCQLWKMKKSCSRIAWFSSLQIDREIDRQIDRQTASQPARQTDR